MNDTSAASHVPMPTLRFSTEMFAPGDRIAAWREHIGQQVLKLDIEPHARDSFRADSTLHALPDLGVFIGGASAALFDRPKRLVVNDDFLLIIALEGTARYVGRGREVLVSPGDAVWGGGGETGFKDSFENTRSMSLQIPKRAIGPAVAGLEDAINRRIPAQTPALQLLRHYLGVLDDPRLLQTPVLQRHVATHILDLIALTVGATRDAAEVAKARGGRAARLQEIMSGIEQNLADPELSAARLGGRLGLSERYVHHLLAGAGLNFSELVRHKRVERARQLLEQPAATPPRIVDIAFAVGFGDLSVFNRAFRQRFDCTPTDVLRGRVLT